MKPTSAPPPSQRPIRLVLFFAGLAALCVLMTLLSLQLFKPDGWAHDEPHGHQWLHEELGLTPEQADRIDAFEAPYLAEKERLQNELDRRIDAIAQLLQTQESYSPDVSAAIHELHIVHGQLQQLSIEHYFDMLSVLPPEKQDKLRTMAAEALSVPQ